MPTWLQILLPFVNLGAQGIEARKAQKLAAIELKTATLKAKAAAAARAAEAEAGWEMLALQDAQSSWKDEFWTILLAIPLVMAFIPGLGGYVKAGFDTLESSVPEWYVWALFAAVSFAFARKKIPKLFGK